MSNSSNKIVKFWRGQRSTYNALGTYDYWTRYSVKETDGTWTEYFGTKKLCESGEFAAVLDIVSELPSSLSAGDRYLVTGMTNDTLTATVVEIGPTETSATSLLIPLGTRCVRVESRGLKRYQIVDNELITYDTSDIIERVVAEHIVKLAADIDTINYQLLNNLGDINADSLNLSDISLRVVGYNYWEKGSGSPIANSIPAMFPFREYYDETNQVFWKSTGTSRGDWQQISVKGISCGTY